MTGTTADEQGAVFRLVEEWAVRFAEEHGFGMLGPTMDRHGSWEITFHRLRPRKPDDDLDRLVSLAFTGLPGAGSAPRIYEVEVWAGAENNSRFTRHLTSEFRMCEDDLETHETLRSILATRLERGFQVANQLTAADLNEAYLASKNPAV